MNYSETRRRSFCSSVVVVALPMGFLHHLQKRNFQTKRQIDKEKMRSSAVRTAAPEPVGERASNGKAER